MTARPSLVLRDVAFAYDDHVVFSSLNLHLSAGWHGLVGPNGAGKTTLLRLVTGALSPDAGSLQVAPGDARIVHCTQGIDACDDDILSLARRDDGDAFRVRGELLLEPAELARWETLSPGERRRWQIGAALGREPDVLLLDEPEGHLDLAGRELLLGALPRFRGIGVVVSHDRALLDALTTVTLGVERGDVRAFPGPWSAAAAAWEAEREAAVATRGRLRGAAQAAERGLERARKQAAAATRTRSARVRMKDRHDHDARGAVAKGRAAFGEAALSRGVAREREAAARAAAALEEATVDRRLGAAIALPFEPSPRRLLLGGAWPEVRAGEAVVLRDVELWLGREDKVQLAGDNGAGKTTLLRALLAASTLPPDRLLWLPQELGPGERQELVRELRSLPREQRGDALNVVAALGTDPERLLRTPRPSPGEARKLRIALGMARRAWVLVLDEPTNHLDLPSVERLEAALSSWPGALLLVTHDAALARAVTTRTWRVADGGVREVFRER